MFDLILIILEELTILALITFGEEDPLRICANTNGCWLIPVNGCNAILYY
jgi:hypothetical protein